CPARWATLRRHRLLKKLQGPFSLAPPLLSLLCCRRRRRRRWHFLQSLFLRLREGLRPCRVLLACVRQQQQLVEVAPRRRFGHPPLRLNPEETCSRFGTPWLPASVVKL
ncbi:unnamed protein product, partial [Ectocarpus sp. 8 AP-2014]